jgi:hypothetical protein
VATRPSTITNPHLVADQLPVGSRLPTTTMRYRAQVVWCVAPDDPGMRRMAAGIHGKRFAAGDATADRRSSAMVFDLSPEWPQLDLIPERPQLSDGVDNIRLFIVAHGVEVRANQTRTVKIATRNNSTTENTLTAEGFSTFVRRLVDQSPARRVRRISLAMCNGGGLRGAIVPQDSFAQTLANNCAGITADITARLGDLEVNTKIYPKATMDELYAENGGQNPLFTITVNGTEQSVINAKKLVDDVEDASTYVFRAGQAPALKLNYRA